MTFPRRTDTGADGSELQCRAFTFQPPLHWQRTKNRHPLAQNDGLDGIEEGKPGGAYENGQQTLPAEIGNRPAPETVFVAHWSHEFEIL